MCIISDQDKATFPKEHYQQCWIFLNFDIHDSGTFGQHFPKLFNKNIYLCITIHGIEKLCATSHQLSPSFTIKMIQIIYNNMLRWYSQ